MKVPGGEPAVEVPQSFICTSDQDVGVYEELSATCRLVLAPRATETLLEHGVCIRYTVVASVKCAYVTASRKIIRKSYIGARN
jgi:hypothetical protein